MASRSTATTARPLDARLNELITQFINRPGYPALSYEKARELSERSEMEVLFGLLGTFAAILGEQRRALTKRQLFDVVEDALTRAMDREAARAADLVPESAV